MAPNLVAGDGKLFVFNNYAVYVFPDSGRNGINMGIMSYSVLSFTVSGRSFFEVFDVLAREVTTLMNDVQQPGTYTVQFNGSVLINIRFNPATGLARRKLI